MSPKNPAFFRDVADQRLAFLLSIILLATLTKQQRAMASGKGGDIILQFDSVNKIAKLRGLGRGDRRGFAATPEFESKWSARRWAAPGMPFVGLGTFCQRLRP